MSSTALRRSEREIAASDGRTHEVTSPEGVSVTLVRAPLISRMGALCIDLVVIGCLAAAFGLTTWALGHALEAYEGWVGALSLVGFFAFRNLYFPVAELTMRGRTPGKRLMGLRVVDAGGGELRGEAIFVRNITRELELLTPVVVLIAPERIWPDSPWPLQLVASLWLVIIALLPLFNRQRLRLGDLLAGTLVVTEPRTYLMRDVAAVQSRNFRFSDEQLDMYGIYELQVLEDFLRGTPTPDSAYAIAGRITTKIDLQDERWQRDSLLFLREFYAALRQRLERRMQLGDRQERKKEGTLQAPR